MNRLIKAELYRFRHTGNLFWYVIFGTIILAAIPFINNLDMLGKNLAIILGQEVDTVGTVANTVTADVSIMMFVMLMPPIIAVISGQLYNKGKLGYYENMTGNRPSRIILSKVFTDGLIFAVLCMFAMLGFYFYIALVNGTGTLDNPVGKLVLEMILITHVSVCSVMIMMTVRRPGVAGVLCYMRFLIFDSVVIPFLMMIAGNLGLEKLALHLGYLSMMNKMQLGLHAAVDRTLVLYTVFGFIAEFILWYVLIFRGLKKKHFD